MAKRLKFQEYRYDRKLQKWVEAEKRAILFHPCHSAPQANTTSTQSKWSWRDTFTVSRKLP